MFAAVSLRWGLVTEPMLLIYNSLLSHLSPDHVRRATELVLDVRTGITHVPPTSRARACRRIGVRGARGLAARRRAPRVWKTGRARRGEPRAARCALATILAAWVQGGRYEMARLPNSTAQGKVSAVVICACMEDLRARGPTPLLGV